MHFFFLLFVYSFMRTYISLHVPKKLQLCLVLARLEYTTNRRSRVAVLRKPLSMSERSSTAGLLVSRAHEIDFTE